MEKQLNNFLQSLFNAKIQGVLHLSLNNFTNGKSKKVDFEQWQKFGTPIENYYIRHYDNYSLVYSTYLEITLVD